MTEFLNMTFDLTKRLKFEVGTVHFQSHFNDWVNGGNFSYAPVTLTQGPGGSEKWDSKVGLNYKATDDLLVYADVAQGFRDGGVNSGLPDVCAKNGVPATYKPDTLTNYEIGWKSTFLDKHLQWNGAFYLMPWKNYQSLLFDPNVCASSSFDANIGNAKIYGSETDIKYAPNSNLSMDVSLSYNDSRMITDVYYTGAAGGFDVRPGERLPYVPYFDWSGNIRYEAPIRDRLHWYTQYDASHKGDMFNNLQASGSNGLPYVLQPGYTIMNLRFGLTSADQGWTSEFYITNLTNKNAVIYTNEGNFDLRQTVNEPRVFGVRLTYGSARPGIQLERGRRGRRDRERHPIRLRLVTVGQDDDREPALRPAHDDVAKADRFPRVPHGVTGDAPTEAIARSGIPGGRGRREREPPRFRPQQAAVVRGRVPFREVVDGGIHPAVAQHGAGEILIGEFPCAVEATVAEGPIDHRRHALLMRDRAAHAQGPKNALLKKRRESLSRDPFHHQREQRVAAVAVAIRASRNEIRARFGFDQVQHIRIGQLPGAPRRNEVFVVDQAGSVSQQLAQGRAGRGLGQRWQPLAYRLIERQRPLLPQLQHGRRGELLGERGEPIIGGARRGNLTSELRHAIGQANERLAVMQHEYARTGDRAPVVAHQLVQAEFRSHRHGTVGECDGAVNLTVLIANYVNLLALAPNSALAFNSVD